MQYTVKERQEIENESGLAYALVLTPIAPSGAPGYGTPVAPTNVRVGGLTAAQVGGMAVGTTVEIAITVV